MVSRRMVECRGDSVRQLLYCWVTGVEPAPAGLLRIDGDPLGDHSFFGADGGNRARFFWLEARCFAVELDPLK